ncbi:sodium:solute symporter [Aureibacter tunicatorum]|uniref:Na+/proline symporter n=1 Tax=Aureibacter tunicatorum TaxID=866807 RepID=A0AAE3XMQ0_9BACT|nr:sodium:solute symporter [Aureibacter tunicatorum]MDR6238740.1 Na+/proline symporter [Aureibacter tunicatorum]BDD05329.1 hypothetical protein AUTU_28120 [Aureibacter tunicatorum]
MNQLDWIVLFSTLLGIVAYGTWKTYRQKNISKYLGAKEENWSTIGLSVMATQASAITFLSTPGLGFEEGLGFVQFYLGLPIAMIVLCATFLPVFYKLNVITAYEYLEQRFNPQTRTLTAFLFLIQRGLAAGITIYAPSIIISTAAGWDLNMTNFLVGILVIIYTVSGGTKAVSITQKWQMTVIFLGMFVAFFILLNHISDKMNMNEAMSIAGVLGKTKALNLDFDVNSKYTLWSGLTGGFFLALSYFGTDQSQVQRYLSGKSLRESRLGLLFNGVMKIPMQLFILLIGVMLFVFYQFEKPPIYFDQTAIENLRNNGYHEEVDQLQNQHHQLFETRKGKTENYLEALRSQESSKIEHAATELKKADESIMDVRQNAKKLLASADVEVRSKESDYVFISFVMKYLPNGIIGLLLAVILSAAMSSTASELNALGSTTTIDIYKRWFKEEASEDHYLKASKVITICWGMIALAFASFAHMVDNLIEAVNILGSLFYGTILGIFLVAFFLKRVTGKTIFISALISEILVLILHFTTDIGYLWFNFIGCAMVLTISSVLSFVTKKA